MTSTVLGQERAAEKSRARLFLVGGSRRMSYSIAFRNEPLMDEYLCLLKLSKPKATW